VGVVSNTSVVLHESFFSSAFSMEKSHFSELYMSCGNSINFFVKSR
jgi:hypothetical protein